MNANSLDEVYLDWLIARVTSPRQRRSVRTFNHLLKQLHDKEFFWLVANDDNRMLDGLELRNVFLAETRTTIGEDDDEWASAGCSVLELLIGLAQRLSDLDGQDRYFWFWHMIENLGLAHFNDFIPYDWEDVDEAISAVIYRTYARNGEGGLFPLEHPKQDQRKVELWYQMNAYLLERE